MSLEQYQEQLQALESARFKLLAGERVVEVRFGETSVQYAQASMRQLDAAIAQLQEKIAHLKGVRRRRVYRASFSRGY